MHRRFCLVKAPVWSNLFYSGYEDLDDPVSDRRRKRPLMKPKPKR